jgi:molybdopterin molybdotransferase
VLVLSGGVSMGDLDLVGRELLRRGMTVLLEKVGIKPGKPLLFGHVAREDGGRCAVFGLPGNPVSSFVTFEVFVRPFLLAWLGQEAVEPDVVHARLEGGGGIKPIPRAQHLPGVLTCGDDGAMRVRPLEWHGSADLRGFVDANGMIVVPEGTGAEPGSLVLVERLANRPIRWDRRPSRQA